LHNSLSRDSLNWFHFSGHHVKDAGILVKDGNFSQIGEALKKCPKLKGVFINGCASKSTLDKLKDQVPICIGTFNPVSDKLATTFSRRFYKKMKEFKSWNDYEKIHGDFNAAMAEIKDLPNVSSDGNNENDRGGGSLQNLEIQENYFISDNSEKNKKLFYQKGLYVFNKILTSSLMETFKDENGAKDFFNSLFDGDEEPWENDAGNLKAAQGKLVIMFRAIIGKELRRLFVLGDEKKDSKAELYINQSLIVYRRILQLTVYLFISILYDEKKADKKNKIKTKEKLIWNFFKCTDRELKSSELLALFKLLVTIFKNHKLDYIIDNEDFGDIEEFLNDDSTWNKACSKLEVLVNLDQMGGHKEEHCQIAEESLSEILKAFKFIVKSPITTIKKIEYERSQYSGERYIKEIKPLYYEEQKDKIRLKTRLLEIDNEAEPSYTVKIELKSRKNPVYLFPFLLDFNALIDAETPHLYFYESLNGKNGMNYSSIENIEIPPTIFFENAEEDKKGDLREIESQDDRDKLKKKIRLDHVTKHFAKAMNILLETEQDKLFYFTPRSLVNSHRQEQNN